MAEKLSTFFAMTESIKIRLDANKNGVYWQHCSAQFERKKYIDSEIITLTLHKDN